MEISTTTIAEGYAIPMTVSLTVEPEMMRAFCELIDDKNPAHFDDEFARSKGFSAAIVHGAIGASLMVRLLSQWLGAWPDNDDEIDVAFVAPIFVGDTVTAQGRCVSVDDEGSNCELWCENQDGKTVLTGSVRIAPRQPDTSSSYRA